MWSLRNYNQVLALLNEISLAHDLVLLVLQYLEKCFWEYTGREIFTDSTLHNSTTTFFKVTFPSEIMHWSVFFGSAFSGNEIVEPEDQVYIIVHFATGMVIDFGPFCKHDQDRVKQKLEMWEIFLEELDVVFPKSRNSLR